MCLLKYAGMYTNTQRVDLSRYTNPELSTTMLFIQDTTSKSGVEGTLIICKEQKVSEKVSGQWPWGMLSEVG